MPHRTQPKVRGKKYKKNLIMQIIRAFFSRFLTIVNKKEDEPNKNSKFRKIANPLYGLRGTVLNLYKSW